MVVAHGDARESQARPEQMVRDKLDPWFEILRFEIGAVIGTHIGPGAAGLM